MTVDSLSPDGSLDDGALAVQGAEPNWAVKVRELLNGRKLVERMKEAEALEAAEEQQKLLEAEEDKVEEVSMEPQLCRVAAEAGAGVCANPRSTATHTGLLQLGDVVTIVGRKGQWLRIADWEAVTGWVRDPSFTGGAADQGQPPVLAPAPEVPEELIHLRVRTARTAVLSWCEVNNIRLQAPLPGAGLGGMRADSIYSYTWGLEARMDMAALGSHGILAPAAAAAWRVYAARDFSEGETVEACELLPAKDGASCHPNSVLWSRTLCPFKGSRRAALPLGFGALYRRTISDEANVEPLLEASDSWVSGSSIQPRMLLRAKRAIKLGEELTASGDFLGAQGGLAWSDAASTPTRGHPLIPPCGTHSSGQIEVRPSPVHGRGVFAERDFVRGDVIELCPALVLDGLGLSLFPDFAMSFDRPSTVLPAVAKPVRTGANNWDPLADPVVSSERSDDEQEEQQLIEGHPGFNIKEPAQKASAQAVEDTDEWDPLAEPSTETLGSAVRNASSAPPPPVPSAEWGDPFSDPAGKADVAVTVVEDEVQPQLPESMPTSAKSPLPTTSTFPDLAHGAATIDDSEVIALPLGSGALYNHAARGEGRNARWALASSRGTVVMMATRRIRQGEELFINYGRDYWATR